MNIFIGAQMPEWQLGALKVAGLGVGQITFGVGMEVFAAAVGFPGLDFAGIVLIREGGSDILFAIKTAVTKTFSWQRYRTEKVVSAALSVVSVGAERWLRGDTAKTLEGSLVRKVGRKLLWSPATNKYRNNLGIGLCLEMQKYAMLEGREKNLKAEVDQRALQLITGAQQQVLNNL